MTIREGAGRTALITGASAGIGMALARVFAAHGFNLVLTARRTERLIALAKELHEAHGIEALPMPADLARPEAPAKLIAALETANIAIDVLVNNAGYSVPGLYRETDWTTQRDFLQVLVIAPCELTRALLPAMMARGYGRILNIASVAGLMPGSASHTLYGAAKSLLIKFSQSLHSEQAGTGVYVCALCPGFTYSEFHDVSGTRRQMSRLPKKLWLSAEFVAQAGYRAVMKNEAISIPSTRYKIISTAMRLLPLNLAYRLGRLRSKILAKRTG
jgi:short-subunit dehydrogenase